jgi:hypothetical protein
VEAAATGWATARAEYPQLRFAAQQIGWKPVEIRRGDAGVTKLAPTPPQKAHPLSHSAFTGTGAQPLHTDGAHLRQPPRWILLHAETPNATAIKLVRLNHPLLMNSGKVSLPTAALGGMFLVSSGGDRFLAGLRTDEGAWRLDPGCMTACDQRAREAVEFLDGLEAKTEQHTWDSQNQVLLIDNRSVLHARGDASDDPDRRLTRLAYNETQP